MSEKFPLPNPLERNPDFDIEKEANLGGIAMIDAQEYQEAAREEESILREIADIFTVTSDLETAKKLLEEKMRELREARRMLAQKRQSLIEVAIEYKKQEHLNALKYPEILG